MYKYVPVYDGMYLARNAIYCHTLASCFTCHGHVMSCNYILDVHHIMDVITSHYMTITCHIMVKGRM